MSPWKNYLPMSEYTKRKSRESTARFEMATMEPMMV